jgi:phosphoglucosamine mutase
VPAKPPIESLPNLGKLMRMATSEFGMHGRHLIRYSGTENKIRVLVEHRDMDACRTWVDRFTNAIREEIG